MRPSYRVDIIKGIVAGSSFYLAIAPFGVAHICFLFGFLILIYNSITSTSDKSIFWLILFLMFSTMQLYIGASWKAMVNNISSMMMYIIIVNILKAASFRRVIDVSESFVRFTTILLALECSVRLVLSIPNGISLYNLKFNSFMFFDTNFCGLLVLALLCFSRYLNKFYKTLELKKYIVINIVLLFLTLSRAAILGYLIFEILFYKIDVRNWKSTLMKRILILSICGLLIGGILFNIAMNDDSFKSKLYILGLVKENIAVIYDIIWTGVGYEHGQRLLGIYPHNFFLLYLIETGLVGLILKIGFVCYVINRTKGIGLFIIIPFLVPIQSAIGYATHYLFVILALITLLERKKTYVLSNGEKSLSMYRKP